MATDTGPTSRTLTDMALIDTDMGRTNPIRPMADMGCGTTPGTMRTAHIASSGTIVTDWRVKSSAKSLMPDVRRARASCHRTFAVVQFTGRRDSDGAKLALAIHP